MRKMLQFYVIAFLFVLLVSETIYSQGTIQGVIYDSLTNKPLIGTNVFLMGTSLGAATNVEGEYRITNIPSGDYSMRISYIGYKQKEIPITITKGKTNNVDVHIVPDILQTLEIMVTGQAMGQVAAINQQLNAPTIVNVVSEERIQELPDVNAAEVLGRLPGVSINRSGGEANKVKIRGLSDKFSYVTIDGVRIPSTDADSRGLDLSTVSQGSLAGIELFKALTPDKDGDAIAGSVNFVTKKAPAERLLRFDSKAIYNDLNENFRQYDFSFKYGERFFDELLGVQLTGNIERRDRSNERIDIDYDNAANNVHNWEIADFKTEYTNEMRSRKGFSLLLDFNTPDQGSIRFNNVFNSTKRDYMNYTRNYPTGKEDLYYNARNRELEVTTFNSSVRGENNLIGFGVTWGLSFGQSESETPWDYTMDFLEPSITDPNGNPTAKMRNIPEFVKKGPPELLIPYALNNFGEAFLYNGYYRTLDNFDKEKTAYLDFSKQYALTASLSGTLKFGGKYTYKTRIKDQSELYAPYQINNFFAYEQLPDGTIRPKNLKGTRFENLIMKGSVVISSNFLGGSPEGREIFDKYNLYPFINREALREWYELNKYGVSNSTASAREYAYNGEVGADSYSITERISAMYLMNTLNLGEDITILAGLRFEREDNTYGSKFTPNKLSGFPISGEIKDTSATYSGNHYLPNLQMIYKPTDFLTLRGSVYKALARPDFNHRLESFIARDGGGSTTLRIGNSGLKTAQAWNFEINASAYSNTLGLFSVSAFYKEIKDMFHVVNGIRVDRASILDSLGITWKSPFGTSQVYDLTYPYNSSKPTKAWGFEVEHQANFFFLPGYLSNIVFSYNFSIVRSETWIASSKTVVWKDSIQIAPGYWVPRENSKIDLVETKQKLEGQPEFFANVSLGYDIGDFSARVSMFYQSEYNNSFSGNGRSDIIINSFTRWDLAMKYNIMDNISVMLNLNNFTNVEEGNSLVNRVENWTLLNINEIYKMTADLGVRVTF